MCKIYTHGGLQHPAHVLGYCWDIWWVSRIPMLPIDFYGRRVIFIFARVQWGRLVVIRDSQDTNSFLWAPIYLHMF